MVLFYFGMVNTLTITESNVPQNAVIKDSSGNIITSLDVIEYEKIPDLKFSCSESDVRWSFAPALPASLYFSSSSASLTGQVTELMETTVFTFTAANQAGSANVTLTFTINDCPYGDFIYLNIGINEFGTLTLLQQGEQKYNAYLSSTGLINAICLPKGSYEYSFECSSITRSACMVVAMDNNNITYLSIYVKPSQTQNGQFNSIAVQPPTISTLSKYANVLSDDKSTIYLISSDMHSPIQFSPPLPEGIEFNLKRSCLQGIWKKAGVFTYYMLSENSQGFSNNTLIIGVDHCFENYFVRFIRKQVAENENITMMDSHSSIVWSYQGKNEPLNLHFCLPEGQYTLHLTKETNKGWNVLNPLLVYNEKKDIIGDFTLIAPATEVTERFVLYTLINEESELRYSIDDVSNKWIKERYNDKNWNVITMKGWHHYDKQTTIAYFRKVFDVNSLHYALMMIEACFDGIMTIYLNEYEILHQIHIQSSQRSQFSIPALALVSDNTNILAIKIEYEQPTLDFSLQFSLRLLTSSCLYRSYDGIAIDDQEHTNADHSPSRAFDNDPITYWESTSLPASLTYTFSNNRYETINKLTFYKPSLTNDIPIEFRIEGINDLNQTTILYTRKTYTLFNGDGHVIISFENTIPYKHYRFVFLSSKSGYHVRVNDIKLYACIPLKCDKKRGYPITPTGVTHYGKCPLFKSGTRQMRCVNSDNEAVWMDDTSACLDIHPSKGIAYVDTSFILYNVTFEDWKLTVDKGFTEILLLYLTVKSNETRYTIERDESTDMISQIMFTVRFTLEEEIGDYVLRHANYLMNDINMHVNKKFGSRYPGISIEVVQMPKLHVPIAWGNWIRNSLIVLLLFIVIVLLYLRTGKKSVGKHLSRSKKIENNDLLLSVE